MDVAFNTQRLRSLCEIEAKMIDRFGREAAEALQVCLADLNAAVSITDITASYAAETLKSFEMVLIPFQGMTLRLRPNDRRIQKIKPINWSHVTRVKIMEIALRA